MFLVMAMSAWVCGAIILGIALGQLVLDLFGPKLKQSTLIPASILEND
jgi:hypothetical protein